MDELRNCSLVKKVVISLGQNIKLIVVEDSLHFCQGNEILVKYPLTTKIDERKKSCWSAIDWLYKRNMSGYDMGIWYNFLFPIVCAVCDKPDYLKSEAELQEIIQKRISEVG